MPKCEDHFLEAAGHEADHFRVWAVSGLPERVQILVGHADRYRRDSPGSNAVARLLLS